MGDDCLTRGPFESQRGDPAGDSSTRLPRARVTQLVRVCNGIAGRHDVRGLAAVHRVRTLAIHGHRSSDRDNLVHRGSAFEASREPADLELAVDRMVHAFGDLHKTGPQFAG